MRELWDGLPGSHAWSHRLEAECPPETVLPTSQACEGFRVRAGHDLTNFYMIVSHLILKTALREKQH